MVHLLRNGNQDSRIGDSMPLIQTLDHRHQTVATPPLIPLFDKDGEGGVKGKGMGIKV